MFPFRADAEMDHETRTGNERMKPQDDPHWDLMVSRFPGDREEDWRSALPPAAPTGPGKSFEGQVPGSTLCTFLAPSEIIDAAEKVRAWMVMNGYSDRWMLGGVCSRDHAERLQRWTKTAEDLCKLWESAASAREELANDARRAGNIDEALPLENGANAYRRCAEMVRASQHQPEENTGDAP